MRRAAFVAVLALVTAGGAMACGQILGIEEKPLRKDASAEASATDAGGGEAEASCTASEQLGCGTCLVHDFCDDWDEGGSATAKWSFGVVRAGTEAGPELVTDDSKSAPGAMRVGVSGTKSTFALAADARDFDKLHPGKAFKGIRYAFDFKVESLAFLALDGGVYDVTKGSSAIAAFIDPTTILTPQSTGVGVLLQANGVWLAASDDIKGSNGTADRVQLYDGNPVVASAGWVRAELVVAPPDEAIARGFTKCSIVASPSTPLVLAGSLTRRDSHECLAIRSTLAAGDWVKKPDFVLGLALFDHPDQGSATGALRFDNVVVDFWY